MSIRSTIGIVDFCVRRPWTVVALAAAIAVGSSVYAARHFAINSDIHDLISPEVPWVGRWRDYRKEFPPASILVVVTAPTPEIADQVTARLADALREETGRFRSIGQPGSGSFFQRNGLLFLPTDDVRRIAGGMIRADPLIGTLSDDPSLRGVLNALSLALAGVRRGDIDLSDLVRPMSMGIDAAEAALAGRRVIFSWRSLISEKAPDARELRRFLAIEPVLDFGKIQPGRAATDAITRTVSALGLESEQGVRVRQTGQIPITDDELGTVTQNAGINSAATLVAVLVILWMALGSLRIILAVLVSLFAGLSVAIAAGLVLVGTFNPISVTFFVLFVGLGVDFGIQFSVRYRAERHDDPNLRAALRSASSKAGGPLALAAVATAVGFSSFLPTAYRGLSELGEIAGLGMIIAFVTSITLLPALIVILRPGGEPRSVGFAGLKPVDRFLERHRIPIVSGTLLLVVAAAPLLLFLRFDFNPMHLRNDKVQSVATYLELREDPLVGANSVEIVAPNLVDARSIAERISALPEVAQAKTVADLVPQNQDEKLKLIAAAAESIGGSLNPSEVQEPPSDQENIEALVLTAKDLSKTAGEKRGLGPEVARRLSDLLTRVAQTDPAIRSRLEAAIVEPLRLSLDQIRQQLGAQRFSIEQMPPELVRYWITPNGRARVQVLPKGDPDDTTNLERFVGAVLSKAPNATGPAVELVEAGNTIVRAFLQAGAFALIAIFFLLWTALRRFGDVLLTLVPLVVAGAVTLELCAILDVPLNFENIIALPLLLGVGVAFKIYYIVAWRSGKTGLLQSSLTRAVLFSAMTSAAAFGSLWLSSHPGTSSMGRLMALALICTMAAAVLFQPVLMGPPRKRS
jgi:hopanoid biosynthesis associated RND transporter like protein HpnN